MTYRVERNNNRLMWRDPRDTTTLMLFLFLKKIFFEESFYLRGITLPHLPFFIFIFLCGEKLMKHVTRKVLKWHPLLVSIKSMINWVNRFCCLSNVICHTYENNSIKFQSEWEEKFRFVAKIEKRKKNIQYNLKLCWVLGWGCVFLTLIKVFEFWKVGKAISWRRWRRSLK